MVILNKQKLSLVAIHIAIWASFILLAAIPIYISRNEIPFEFIKRALVNIVFFYINYALLVPKFLLKKRTYIYLVSIILILLISSNLEMSGSFFVDGQIEQTNNIRLRVFPTIMTLHFLLIGLAIKVYQEWASNEKKKSMVQAEKNLSELEALKNQINPHFLFNSLNSIYSLTVKKSNDAPEAVIMLSELMRYMLYQTNDEFVMLTSELDYIKNYVSLQKMRLLDQEHVELYIKGTVTTQRIRPLLFVSIIENAFKYGTSYDGQTKIKIVIKVEDDILEFQCENGLSDKKYSSKNSGIGLQNTMHRFDLLYPNNHKIRIQETEATYKVNITLRLN